MPNLPTARSRAIVELKVIGATAAAGVVGVGATVLNQTVGDEQLLGGLPVWAQTLITMLVPPVATFAAGWSARHTPRPDLAAGSPGPAAPAAGPAQGGA